MTIEEVHDTLVRSLGTTIKICESSIEFYSARIKELTAVIKAAQTAGASEVLPKTTIEANSLANILDKELNPEPKRGPKRLYPSEPPEYPTNPQV